MKINLIIKTFFLFLSYISVTLSGSAQEKENGIPYIRNFLPEEYGYESQNYNICQTERGLMYISNLSGILEYDGTFWSLIEVPGKPRIAINHKSKIFVGGYNDYGIIKTDTVSGKKRFVSLVNTLRGLNKNKIGEIQKVACHNNSTFFLSQKYIIAYNSGKSRIIDGNKDYLNIFKLSNKLFICNYQDGIREYLDGELIPLKNNFKHNIIEDIIPAEGGILIKIKKENYFHKVTDDGEHSILNIDFEDLFAQNNYVKSIRLPNGNYIVGTARCGLIIFNSNGKLQNIINKNNGLYSNEITGLYIDKQNHLWVATYNGFSYIELPSAFSYYKSHSGLDGNIYDITRFKNIIYTASSQGLFYLKERIVNQDKCISLKKFERIKGINFNVYKLYIIKGELMASTENGVYRINKNKAEKIYEGVLKVIYHSKTDSSIIYLGTNTGVECMKYINGAWISQGKIENINIKVKTISEDSEGFIWFGTDYDGIIKADMRNGHTIKPKITTYKKGDNGLPQNFSWVDVYPTQQGIIYSTSSGLYRYSYKNNLFSKDTLIGIDFSSKNHWVYPIKEDKFGNLWISSGTKDKYEKKTAVAYYNGKGRKHTFISQPFRKMKYFTVETIFPDKNGIVWYGGNNGIIRFDTKQLEKSSGKFYPLIRKLEIGSDSIIYPQMEEYAGNRGLHNSNNIPEIFFKYNSVKFSFSAPFFFNNKDIKYKSYLEPFDKSWSNWANENTKVYTNLPAGEYTLKIRASDIYNNISDETHFKFTILPSLYHTWYAYLAYFILLASLIFMLIKWRSFSFAKERYNLELLINERTEELVRQKERSEELVANILPKKEKEEALKKEATKNSLEFEKASILYIEIGEIINFASNISTENALQKDIQNIFSKIDNIIDEYNITKIKISDTVYICAGGIPQKNSSNPIDTVSAAFEIQQYLKQLKNTIRQSFKKEVSYKLAVNTGAISASKIQSKNFNYDIWGDTVTNASHIISEGENCQINISETTYNATNEFFVCQYKGKIEVKFKGKVKIYHVKSLRPELSLEHKGIIANDLFRTRLMHTRFEDLKEKVYTKLKGGLPDSLYYHNLQHTRDVVSQVEIIGKAENISEHDMLLLKTAALYHDNGFLIGYDDHEEHGIKMAKDNLPKYGYNNQEIRKISDLIYATKFPPAPKNTLENIICDADLDYLGRTDFIPISQNLYRELFERGKIKTIESWNRMQIAFIENHQYFTETARKLRNVNKNKQLEELRKMV